MKKLALPAAILAAVSLTACNQESAESQSAAAPAAAAEVALEASNDRLSYGMAYNFGQRLAAEGMDVSVDAFAAGLRDAVSGAESRLTPEEIMAEMQSFQEKAQAARQQEQEQLAVANLEQAQTFMAENAQREGVVVTDTGLQYEIVEAGEGELPGPDDRVEVHYRGTLIDGTEFDSSYKRDETIVFGVGQVIAGWSEALQLMPVGSKWNLYIPPELAYGAGGAGNLIGPNAALLFEVELISIEQPEEEAAAEAAEG